MKNKTKPIFCKDCASYVPESWQEESYTREECVSPRRRVLKFTPSSTRLDPVEGKVFEEAETLYKFTDPRVQNRNFNCLWFTPRRK